MAKLLFVVSANLQAPAASQAAPRKDYDALRAALGATVLDRSRVEATPAARAIAGRLGMATAQAWLAWRERDKYDAILTDGEHLGIPLAALLKLSGSAVPHVTIGHRLTAPKKRPFFRWLRVQTHLTRIALHARQQYDLATHALGIPAERLALVPYQADTAFWRPQGLPEEALVCSAGLEFRDYPTLLRAAQDLPARVVIGAASYWSHRRNTAAGAPLPANVTVGSFDYRQLRDLYARAAVVVVPLQDTDFQAGVTTILEAMAMGKAVVVTESRGQTDVVADRRRQPRGGRPPRPPSFLRDLAAAAGVEFEPNGFYVPPGDPDALRRALDYLLARPAERARLGAAGRHLVARLLTVDQFADRLRALVDDARRTPHPLPAGGDVARVPATRS